MNKYIVQITEYHGEFIDADYLDFDESRKILSFYTYQSLPKRPRCVAKYNLDKIYGFREFVHNTND